MNRLLTNGGHWLSNRPDVTGAIGYLSVTAVSALLSCPGTGSGLTIDQLIRGNQQTRQIVHIDKNSDYAWVRSPSESLTRIREVLRPAISDLALTLSVSRQTVYNWINGETPSDENATKLNDLAEAADILTKESVKINAAFLKRKIANGRTLMQIVQTGESARDAAHKFIEIHKREALQRERINSRFQNRAITSASADFDLPAPNDQY